MKQGELIKGILSKRGMLIAYIMQFVRDFHLAEDVYQNVVVLLIEKSPVFENDHAMVSWLRQSARFESLRTLREKKRDPVPLENSVLESLEKQWSTMAQDLKLPQKNRSILKKCLEKLTPRSRQLVALRYGEGIKSGDLSRRLEKPLNTIYVALTRIHRSLSECAKSEKMQGALR